MTSSRYNDMMAKIAKINNSLGESPTYKADRKLWDAVSDLTDLVEVLVGHIFDHEYDHKQ